MNLVRAIKNRSRTSGAGGPWSQTSPKRRGCYAGRTCPANAGYQSIIRIKMSFTKTLPGATWRRRLSRLQWSFPYGDGGFRPKSRHQTSFRKPGSLGQYEHLAPRRLWEEMYKHYREETWKEMAGYWNRDAKTPDRLL